MRPPFQYQYDSAKALASSHVKILRDPPGYGKTATMLLASHMCGDSSPAVVSPASARLTWQSEGTIMDTTPQHLSYDNVVRGAPMPNADVLLIDELHKMKDIQAKRTRMVLAAANGYDRVYLSSGTMMPKNPMDLWPTLHYLFPDELANTGLLGYDLFMEHFCVTTRRPINGQWVTKVTDVLNPGELRALIDRVSIHSTFSPDVPPLHIVPWVLDVGDYKTTDPVLAAKLREVAEGVREFDTLVADKHMAIERRNLGVFVAPIVAAELIEQLQDDAGAKVVVFAYNREVLGMLFTAFQSAGLGPVYIDGSTSTEARQDAIHAFQTEPRTRVFVGQNQACMESLTLTAANRVVSVQPEWTYTSNVQNGSRVARVGQTAEKCVMQLVMVPDTLSQAVVGHHYREEQMQRKVFGTT